MLINDSQIMEPNFLLDMIAKVNGNSSPKKHLLDGVYQIGHFGSSDSPHGYNHYPTLLDFDEYGVCDNVQQILEQCPELEASKDRKFLITVTPVLKSSQSADGGWRWHKWGPYIGTHEIKHEYLYDEAGIEQVLVYHIYEKE